MILASAPGKLVLSGEYAVLTGSPAVVMAVGVRAEVCISASTVSGVRSEGPGETAARFRYHADGTIDWAPGDGGDYRLLAAVLATLADAEPLPEGCDFAAILDTRAFFEGPHKLGLGSSAALTVALTAALGRHFGRATASELAYRAHRRLQGGGSGLDIAAALAGGLLVFLPVAAGLPAVDSLDWPVGLHAGFLWSGRSAATSPRVRRFLDWSAGATAANLVSRLAEEARSAAAAWASGEVGRIIGATRDYARRLRQLGDAAGIDIYGGGHDAISRLADAAGVVYKPSGAGGGDLGVALSTDTGSLQQFLTDAGRAGYTAVDLVPDHRGLAIGS